MSDLHPPIRGGITSMISTWSCRQMPQTDVHMIDKWEGKFKSPITWRLLASASSLQEPAAGLERERAREREREPGSERASQRRCPLDYPPMTDEWALYSTPDSWYWYYYSCNTRGRTKFMPPRHSYHYRLLSDTTIATATYYPCDRTWRDCTGQCPLLFIDSQGFLLVLK